MDPKKINRIIDFIREEMMTTGSAPGKPGFSGKADDKGPTAGFDPLMKLDGRNKYVKKAIKDLQDRRDKRAAKKAKKKAVDFNPYFKF